MAKRTIEEIVKSARDHLDHACDPTLKAQQVAQELQRVWADIDDYGKQCPLATPEVSLLSGRAAMKQVTLACAMSRTEDIAAVQEQCLPYVEFSLNCFQSALFNAVDYAEEMGKPSLYDDALYFYNSTALYADKVLGLTAVDPVDAQLAVRRAAENGSKHAQLGLLEEDVIEGKATEGTNKWLDLLSQRQDLTPSETKRLSILKGKLNPDRAMNANLLPQLSPSPTRPKTYRVKISQRPSLFYLPIGGGGNC